LRRRYCFVQKSFFPLAEPILKPEAKTESRPEAGLVELSAEASAASNLRGVCAEWK
jgi:hypothetical protein